MTVGIYPIRFLILVLIGCISTCPCTAQWSFGAHYNYLRCEELDQVIQAYNSSRPWQEDKLVPLTQGVDLEIGYNWKIAEHRSIHVQPHINYRRFASAISTNGNDLSVAFHQATFGLEIRWSPRALITGVHYTGPLGTRWFLTTTPGLSAQFAMIRKNEKNLVSEDENYRPITNSFYLSLGTGYHAGTLGRFVVTPHVDVMWFPSMEIPELHQAVIGTTLPSLTNDYSDVLFIRAGIRFTFLASENNWWDRPNSGIKRQPQDK